MTYPPQQFPPQQPQIVVVQKKSNAWKWVLGILGGLLLLCGGGAVACTALVAGGVNSAVEEERTKTEARTAENSKTCAGKSYPDQQPNNDRCADAANSIVLDGVTVTATPLKRVKTDLCTDVRYANNSDGTVSFNVFDWKLQLPTGEVQDAWDSSSNGNSLDSGDLVRGGTKAGTVCYKTSGSGQHVLIYKPTFWNDSRGIWVNIVTG